jgi:hypothetical protein
MLPLLIAMLVAFSPHAARFAFQDSLPSLSNVACYLFSAAICGPRYLAMLFA